jgi:hypothetical protein
LQSAIFILLFAILVKEFICFVFIGLSRDALNLPQIRTLQVAPWRRSPPTGKCARPASLPTFTELTWGLGVHPIGACDTTESPVRSLWEKANLNWVWTWMAVYGGSLSVLAAYLASTITAAAASEIRSKN